MPQLDVALQVRPPQVDVAILQAHFFVGQHRIAGREGQCLAVVQQAQLVGDHLDFAGGNVLVDRTRITQFHVSDHRKNKFRANGVGFVMNFGAGVGGDDDLGDAAAVAQIEEDNVAEIAAAIDPPHEHNFRAGVGGAQLATHMSPF